MTTAEHLDAAVEHLRAIGHVGEESSTQLEAVALAVENKLKETLNGK